MKIPKQVTVGKSKIAVVQPDGLKVGNDICRGGYDYSQPVIMVAKGNLKRKTKFTPSQRANTFWHELTHAILHDMGENKLNHNEQFVSDFADRLDQAIKTARF
jgi:Zn-dependent peptidase ImmA (M78 family)